LQINKNIALVLWDGQTDMGFQLEGTVEDMQVFGMLDGYWPEAEAGSHLPQSFWRITVRVDKVMEFKHALHDDAGV